MWGIQFTRFSRHCRAPAFTLIELLVVIGVIATLISLLLTAVPAARREARAVQCQSNLRQLAAAMVMYAATFDGRFPPNIARPVNHVWSDEARLGTLIPPPGAGGAGDASVYVCPEDDDARLSYAMNMWASAKVDAGMLKPADGIRWRHGVRGASRMILLIEAWSYVKSKLPGFAAPAGVGAWGAPGRRLGGGGALPPFSAGRWGKVNCEVTYARHRRSGGPGTKVEPRGRVAIAFADGHVEMLTNDSLVDPVSGKLTGMACWSLLDLP